MNKKTSSDYTKSLRTVVKGAGLVFIGMILSKVFTYAYRIFIARYFGPDDYGIFSIALAVIGLLITFSLLGLPTGVSRFIAEYRAKKDERRVKGVITSALKMVLPTSVFFAFVLLFFSSYIANNIFHEPELTDIFIILSFSLPFTALFGIVSSSFVGFEKIEHRVYSENIFQNLSRLLLIIIFGMVGLGMFGLAWAWTIAAILTFFISLYLLEKHTYPIIKTKIVSIQIKKELLTYSSPLILVGFFGLLIMWTDTLMLGYFIGARGVGIYNAALPTAQLLFIVPDALVSLFLPVITAFYVKRKKREFKHIYNVVTRWIFYINFPLFLLLIFFSKDVLNILFGVQYIAGYKALIILSAGFMIYKTVPANSVLQMLKKTRHLMYIMFLSTSINIILNYILIQADFDLGFIVVGGINGAAIATMFTYITLFVLMFVLSYKFTKAIPFSIKMLKSFVSSISAILFIFIVSRLVFATFSIYIITVLFLLFMFIYILSLLAFKSFDNEDKMIMKEITKRMKVT